MWHFKQKRTRIDVSTRVGATLYIEGKKIKFESEIQVGGKEICIFEYSKPRWEPPFQDEEISKERYGEIQSIVIRLLFEKNLSVDWQPKDWWTSEL
jgi:hypothetical protein